MCAPARLCVRDIYYWFWGLASFLARELILLAPVFVGARQRGGGGGWWLVSCRVIRLLLRPGVCCPLATIFHLVSSSAE